MHGRRCRVPYALDAVLDIGSRLLISVLFIGIVLLLVLGTVMFMTAVVILIMCMPRRREAACNPLNVLLRATLRCLMSIFPVRLTIVCICVDCCRLWTLPSKVAIALVSVGSSVASGLFLLTDDTLAIPRLGGPGEA